MEDTAKGSCCAVSRNASEPAPTAVAAVRTTPAIAGERSNPIFIPGCRSHVGFDNPAIPLDGEGPARNVKLNAFALEAETVTVRRFADFVAATGYVSEAERFGWSAVFAGLLPADTEVTGNAPSTPWWVRVEGAYWRRPEGPASNVDDRLDHPVTQVSYADALAFADWVGGRLASEAEWERAAHSGVRGRKFAWGNEEPDDNTIFCNIWQGNFRTPTPWPTAIWRRHPPAPSSRMKAGSTTWPAMSGNGPPIPTASARSRAMPRSATPTRLPPASGF
nr:SUMF1/EgtB/PvdO family nonheme iron enzyme [Marinicella sp. W31]MDC2877787.1 SUMF1/EgtB/PvdO family nonheme iron enzyme [Marinicella sp. W31]